MSVRIFCINKAGGRHDDPHEAITGMGWVNEQSGQQGYSTRDAMHDFVKRAADRRSSRTGRRVLR